MNHDHIYMVMLYSYQNNITLVVEEYNGAELILLVPNVFKTLVRVAHIHVSKLTIIGSDNGLSPGQREAII